LRIISVRVDVEAAAEGIADPAKDRGGEKLGAT
jgi:hypothetical protein